jgi:aspartyl-tRNA(Asn)/glutamyl-tRNA(Gln) amidotransferase subunit C
MLTEQDVRHIALLARIGITEEEVKQYQKDLSSVLDFFRELEQLPMEDTHLSEQNAGVVNVARTDQSLDSDDVTVKAIMRNVPMVKDEYVKVKSVF